MANIQLLRYKREMAMGLGLSALLTRKQPKVALPLAFAALGLYLMPRSLDGYNDMAVVITGGSRGLGLELAKQLIASGAKVTLIARDFHELERAEDQLRADLENYLGQKKADVCDQLFTVVCDVTNETHFDTALAEARARFGKIDMLINNAGSILAGPLETMENSDYEAQIRLHLNAVISATRLIRPYFHQNGGGRIVNISSIGGLFPVPHLSAYCASKFALSGFSETSAAELAPENISVTTVYPGLMRTGSPIQAVFKGDAAREFEWFAATDSTPFLTVSAPRAARELLVGALDRKVQVIVSLPAKLAHFARALAPELVARINAEVAARLPSGSSKLRHTGAQFRDKLSGTPLDPILRKSESDHNQIRKLDADFNLGV